MKKLVLIDSYALIHRAYHALPPLTSPEGVLVNGVYGFALVFFKMLRDINPDYVVAAFDMAAPTFRKKEYQEYKAGRQKMPDNFYRQVELVHQLLRKFQVPILEKAGYEADDIIGTVVEQLKEEDIKIIILTGDLDTLQLVSDKVEVYTMSRGVKDSVIYNLQTIKNRFGLFPSQIVDWKALRGDPSDNVPGVPGIGEKTAQKLIARYQNLDNLYQALEAGKITEVSSRIKKLLSQYKEQAYFSQHLVTIKRDVDVNLNLQKAEWHLPPKQEVSSFLEELGFYSLLNKLFPEENVSEQSSFVLHPITTLSQLKQLKTKINNAQKIGLLLDFSGNKFINRTVKGLGIALSSQELFYMSPNLIPEVISMINLSSKPIVSFATKILYEHWSIPSQLKIKDTKILAWLLDSSRKDYEIPSLVETILSKEIVNDFASQLAYLLPLEDRIETKIQALELERVWEKIEKPLIPILALMEKAGILVDRQRLAILSQDNQSQVDKIKKEIFQIAGQEFNINSRIQLEKILFDQLKISPEGIKKTAKGNVSLNAQSLTIIKDRHPIIPLIIQYRTRKKLQNSFLDTLPNFIDKETGRIYTIWKQTGTSTGRLSSEQPNLQNIPQSKKDLVDLRTIFLSAPGWELISFDYSQMELRLAAHLSQDENLQKVFREGKDVHVTTASYINNVPEEKVTPTMRQQAKALNFGILYGMGVKSFAEQANIPLTRAKQFKEQYFQAYPGLQRFLEYLPKRAKELGYAETIFGRKRFLPLIGGYGRVAKEQERMALNMPIQGLAADIIKLAMIAIQNYLISNHLQEKARILLQVHDELILEVQPAIIKEILEQGKKIMEEVIQLNVPLVVKSKVGNNWGQMKIL